MLYFTQYFTCFGASRNGARRNLENLVLAGSPGTVLRLARLTVFRDNVLSVFEVQECPELSIAPQDYAAAPASVATVRPALGIEFLAMKMKKTRAAFPEREKNLT